MKRFPAQNSLCFRTPLTTLFLLVLLPSWAQTPYEARIDSLLAIMSLEEKVGQMNQYNGFWEATGPVPEAGDAKEKYDHLRAGLVGSMLNIKGVENVRKIQEIVVEQSRLGIPLIFGFDVIHGQKTVMPIPLAEAASWDLAAMETSARMAAREAAALGINWTFAPMLDISRDARWGRVMEGAGEDPYLASKIAAARVRGFQGQDLADPLTIAACAKHFAAYGFSESGKDYNTVDIGTVTLHNVVLPPFKAALEANVQTVMNSFNVLNGIPATANAFLMRNLLKEGWGFNGFVISDWGSGREMIDHGFARDLMHVAQLAANAGSDMDMESYAYVRHLVDLVNNGRVSHQVIDDAVRRILRVKFALGLFDDPYRYCDSVRQDTLINHPEHHAFALEMAKKSIVLLKNDQNLLPLPKKGSRIAVIGDLADDKNSPLGSWRLGSDDNTAVSILEGLQQYRPDLEYVQGVPVFLGETTFINELNINYSERTGMTEAVAMAKSADIVVMVLGEHGFQSGEGRSRTDIDLPGLQQELLETVFAVNQNVVLVMMNGRPLTINWAAEHLPAILEVWQLGSQTGHAVASVLFGDYNPSGKLPMTFPKSVGQIPIYYNHYRTGRPEPSDLVFWSHYTDEANAPLYPFGYGLSYTTFTYGDLDIKLQESSSVEISCTVTNTGAVAGEEVAQLYLHDVVASVVRPVKQLKGFEKFKLEPGMSHQVKFVLTEADLGFYDGEGNFLVEPGTFEVMVGGNSNANLTGSFEWR